MMISVFRRPSGVLAICCAAAALIPSDGPAVDLSVVERWMATNKGVQTLSIDFTQTRTMRSLNVPITQTGTLWINYAASQFRWQTGNPPQTIVVRRGNDLFILRTALKKYERRVFGSESSGPAGMAALAGGFPRSMTEFQQKYRVLNISPRDNTFRIATQPLGSAGRGVNSFTFVVNSSRYQLVGIEIDLKDGSSLDTVFNQVRPNVSIPSSLFAPDLTGYREAKF